MSENVKPNEAAQETDLSCRELGAVSFAAGLAAVAGGAAATAAERSLTETDVTVKTPDGNCDAVFIHPTARSYPDVLIWTDVFGLRPSMRQFARRIAADGYSVLVSIPFYRAARAAVFDNPSRFDFGNPADTAKLPPLTGPLNVPGAVEKGSHTWRLSMPRRRSTGRARSAPKVTGWAVRWSSKRPRQFWTASPPAQSAQWRDRGARWNRERETGKGSSA